MADFYSSSLNMRFPVSTLDWGGWYQKIMESNPLLDDHGRLAELIRRAFIVALQVGMPWPEQEDYVVLAIATAGWTPPARRFTPDGEVRNEPDGAPSVS